MDMDIPIGTDWGTCVSHFCRLVTAVALVVESGVQCGVDPHESHLRALIWRLFLVDPYFARLHCALDATENFDALHELGLHRRGWGPAVGCRASRRGSCRVGGPRRRRLEDGLAPPGGT